MENNREAIRRIMISMNVINGIYDMIAKKIGIKENALALLYALDDGKAHSQKEICEEWLIPKTTLNTIVKECIKKDIIVLESNQGKKEKVIRLTDAGHYLAENILQKVYQIEENAMKQTLNEISIDFIHDIEIFTDKLKEEVMKYKTESNKQ